MKVFCYVIFPLIWAPAFGQSFETMTGNERIFIDAQFLEFIDKQRRVSQFLRSRATTEYLRQNTDLFTGAYLNYTVKSGFGGTILGRISSNNSGIDAGLHYFKASKLFMVYALPSINLNKELLYSWFSIFRFTPDLNENWSFYSSLELFSAFGKQGHLSSVQRSRIGLNKNGYQFGVAVNLNESRFSNMNVNSGVFLRKQFE